MKCKGVLITCEDFRLHQRLDGSNLVAEFIKKLGFECDLITRAGAILDLVHPEDTGEGFNDSLLRDTKVSAVLHKADRIILLGHEDCGAYGYLNLSKAATLNRVQADLRQARNIMRREFSRAETSLYVARLLSGSEDKFEIAELK